MEIEITPDEVASMLSETLRVEFTKNEDQFVFNFERYESNKIITSTVSDIQSVIDELKELEVVDELTLISQSSIEVLVREESHFPRLRGPRDDWFSLEDPDSSCSYSLNRPSKAYLVFLMLSLYPLAGRRAFPPPPPRSIAMRMIEEANGDIFEIATQLAFRFLSLKIVSLRPKSKNEFQTLTNSLLFQLSYNLDASLVVQRHIEEIARTGRITRFRRASLSEIDPPRRKYIPDLVYHYQLAVASDNPFLEFISYYHIAEHFFEAVFNDDLLDSIKSDITRPDFSYKRKKDVAGLIKKISKSLQVRNESITFNELNALKLTIKKYVKFDSVRQKIDEYDEDLRDFYRTNKVEFSDGNLVNFESPEEELVANLAARIYSTRNAIVHSKESEKSRYIPFRHDKLLLKEIPLVRFVAEEIILESSEILQ